MNSPNRPSDALFVLAWIPIVIVVFGTLNIIFHY